MYVSTQKVSQTLRVSSPSITGLQREGVRQLSGTVPRNTASSAPAHLEGLLVVALAEIIGTSVDDQGSSNDGVLSKEADLVICDVEVYDTASVGLYVS